MPYKIIKEVNEDIVFICVSCGFKTKAREFPNGVLIFDSLASLGPIFEHSDVCELRQKFPKYSEFDYCTD